MVLESGISELKTLYMQCWKINSIFLKKSSKKGLTNGVTFAIITPVAARERTKRSERRTPKLENDTETKIEDKKNSQISK